MKAMQQAQISECFDTSRMYKSRLQEYTQKQGLCHPVYACETEGSANALRFKPTVSVGGKSYRTIESFSTKKDAERAVAKVACEALSVEIIQEGGILYKNLLQEFAQKNKLAIPSYNTVWSGIYPTSLFFSIVEVGGISYQGPEARTKKHAEMSAARVAYCALIERSSKVPSVEECAAAAADNLTQNVQLVATKKKCNDTACEGSSRVLSVNKCAAADNLTQNMQPIATTKNHHSTTNEEPRRRAKKFKSSSGNMSASVHLLGRITHGQTTTLRKPKFRPIKYKAPALR
ncbi:double-stranded RNA-binding protein 4 [Phtheirospermum japonicum]|uniref:Double-stranded RNA-binding protein 4 n=1 Tax=Phtheirospermum japonicum TaxID=374723 RepID=A0A830C4H5_9LAMI|nr:double-stranded RNA-binding protein 4 [Phtheirospermum japonicum]